MAVLGEVNGNPATFPETSLRTSLGAASPRYCRDAPVGRLLQQ